MERTALVVRPIKIRWLYLILGTLSQLFAGIIYAWSILKVPLAEAFNWDSGILSLNYTLMMCFVCLGGMIGSRLLFRIGPSKSILLSALFAGSGFIGVAFLQGSVLHLLLCYAMAAGIGIGMFYNLIISTVNTWFPDRRGLSSGCLMMGFGLSTLLFGTVFDVLFAANGFGWRKTYFLFGAAIILMLGVTGVLVRAPGMNQILPQPKEPKAVAQELFEQKDWPTGKMIRRGTFWRAFFLVACIAAVGNSSFSFAREYALSVGASLVLATALVGTLSVCNGLGRISTGIIFDIFGRKVAMMCGSVLAVLAAVCLLFSAMLGSLLLCVVGFCLTGLAYGSTPTICSVFLSTFYGLKYFSSNYSVINCTLMASSFAAAICNGLLTQFGTYTAPFVFLLAMALGAMALNLSIRRP